MVNKFVVTSWTYLKLTNTNEKEKNNKIGRSTGQGIDNINEQNMHITHWVYGPTWCSDAPELEVI